MPSINQGKCGQLSPSRGKRRGVSEIIATLLLVAVTVVGGVLAMTLVGTITDEAGAFGNIKAKQELRLIGYDTRDGTGLGSYTNLNNNKNSPTPFLCTTGCSSTPDNIPSSSGTEFIVIYLHNTGLDDIFLDDIIISTDNISHEWDGDTANAQLSTLVNDSTAPYSYPRSGKYSIIEEDDSGLEQNSDTIIKGGQVVRVIVKLSSQISDDINIDDTIPITVTTTDGGIFKFKIHGGSVE